MTASAKVEAYFGGGTRTFFLDVPQLEELQEKADCGPEWLLQRIGQNAHGGWRSKDIQQTLRLGLIGGGMKDFDAGVMVERYAGPGQLAEHKKLCVGIIAAAIYAPADEVEEDDPPGESKGATGSPAAKSGSAPTGKRRGPRASTPKV